MFLAALLAGDFHADDRENGGPGAYFYVVLAAATLFTGVWLRRAGLGWRVSGLLALLVAPAAVLAVGLGFGLVLVVAEVA